MIKRGLATILCHGLLATAVLSAGIARAADAPDARGIEFFEKKVRPVLVEQCYQCHSSEADKAKKLRGGLRLDTREGLRKGGDTGPAIVPGKPAESLLIQALRHDTLRMPPKGKLPDEVAADFAKWVEMGAPDPRDGSPLTAKRVIDVEAGRKYWAFQPLAAVAPPPVKDRNAPLTPIDRFIQAKLETKKLTLAPAAGREQLIRRAYFDLLGLPPSPAEIDAFVNDRSPDAYEQLIDRLLASERHGERWARHWLDVVRFAESGGYEFDRDRPGAYHYRDFVIKALNQDMPFDQFVRWQVAGDQLEPKDLLAVSATGFLVAGPFPGQTTAKTRELIRYDQLDDMVATLGTSLLGLSLGCARCHDHKYDPLPQQDYYHLLACLARTDSANLKIDDNLKEVDNIKSARKPVAPPNTVFAAASGKGGPVYHLIRGEVERKNGVASPGFIQVLMNAPEKDRRWLGDDPAASKSKKAAPTPATEPRVALAKWLTDTEAGAGRLLARVIVNRLWQHHMGKGLVRTPNDFGAQGEPPTHPELLDWLAAELIRNDCRLKPIHRLIMTSAVYRQSGANRAALQADPQNLLWGRVPPRRLESEAIRDALLAVSGTLDPRMFGPGTLEENGARRSIYLTVKRSRLVPLMQMFDSPEPIQSIGERQTTTVATQALAMMNSPFVRQRAEKLAQRVRPASPEELPRAVAEAYLLVLGRQPTIAERDRTVQFIRGQTPSGKTADVALADVCQVLLCLNEFVYVD